MLKKLLGVVIVVVAGAGIMLADEAKGKVKSWDKDTKSVKITVGDKDVDYVISKDAKVLLGDDEIAKGKARGKMFTDNAGSDVAVTFTKDGDKITVTMVKVVKK